MAKRAFSPRGRENVSAQHSWGRDGICSQFCPWQPWTSDNKSTVYDYICTRAGTRGRVYAFQSVYKYIVPRIIVCLSAYVSEHT